jgi:hypothetical protein
MPSLRRGRVASSVLQHLASRDITISDLDIHRAIAGPWRRARLAKHHQSESLVDCRGNPVGMRRLVEEETSRNGEITTNGERHRGVRASRSRSRRAGCGRYMPLKPTITGERAASAASATVSSASADPPDSAPCALEMSAVQAGSPIRPVSTTSARCRLAPVMTVLLTVPSRAFSIQQTRGQRGGQV